MPPSFPNSDIKLVSPVGLSLLFGAALISYITYIICCAIYNLFFHQLREFPGPKAWIAFPILRHIANIRGVLDKRLRELHEIHGDVVRFSDKELSFITAQSWKDIYAYGNGHKQLRKEIFRDLGQPSSIINADDADHARYRKTLSHAFSEKGLREQEPLIKIYIDLLIEKLHDVAASGEKTDMVKWYNLTTFDLIGDLAFGEPFDGLKNSELHFWVKMLFQGIKMISFHRMAAEYPLVDSLFKLLLPKSLIQSREKHRDYTAKTVMKRITNRAAHGRGDFMDSMLRHRGTKDGLTDDEIVSQARVLIIAGSETTATLLSGVTYLLLKNPEALKKVAAEVRAAFEHEDEINFFNTTARLPYMLACLQECFRLYPPVPSGLQRYAQPGVPTQVSGYQVPPGTLLSVHQSAAYQASSNFRSPHSYVPERWLPESTSDPLSPFYNDNRAVLQPFSCGPRNCIGQNLAYNEMRLIFARVLWNFDLELCEESQQWIDGQKSYLIWEKPGLLCRLSVRQDRKA